MRPAIIITTAMPLITLRQLVASEGDQLTFPSRRYVFGNPNRDKFLVESITAGLRVYKPSKALCEKIFINLFQHMIDHLPVRDGGDRDRFWQCVTESWVESSGVSPALLPDDVRNIALNITRAERNYAGAKTAFPSLFLFYVRDINSHFKNFESESDEAVEALEEIESEEGRWNIFEAPKQRCIPWQEPGEDGRIHVPPRPQPEEPGDIQVKKTLTQSARQRARRKQKRREEAKNAEKEKAERQKLDDEFAKAQQEETQKRVEEGKKKAEAVPQKIMAGRATAGNTPQDQHMKWNPHVVIRPATGMKRPAPVASDDEPLAKRLATLTMSTRCSGPQIPTSTSTVSSTAASTAVSALTHGPARVPAASTATPHGLGQRSIQSILGWQPEPVQAKGNDGNEEAKEGCEDVIL